MSLPRDYLERVYAGVLGKIIGVYLGRPFEAWPYERIVKELGEIQYYVHERLGVPLIVADDDITGTFTFIRALADYGIKLQCSAQQIGHTWLNYIVEGRAILWWGGLGNSTEHTAYLRLKQGFPAPLSGSTQLNGLVASEQIGGQIFIDGWALVSPGDPARAAEFAKRAASVSHDGECIYAAQVIAAMEAQAFVETELNLLLDTALKFIPKTSVIYRMIGDIRGWHTKHGDNWRQTRQRIVRHYGYSKFGGGVHVVPNHAVIIMSLLHGNNDFQRSLMIANTSGWDTDCNSGNVGCLLGIKNGLKGLDTGPDWRGPVADRLYLPTADGGRAISDAVIETFQVVNIARALNRLAPLRPKSGARFHFELPGSGQGFQAEDSIETNGTVTVANTLGNSKHGERSLAIHYRGVARGRPARVASPTFIPSVKDALFFEGGAYDLLASPTLYPGQTVRAHVSAEKLNSMAVTCCLYLRCYGKDDNFKYYYGRKERLTPGSNFDFVWMVNSSGTNPIAAVGLEISSLKSAEGTVYLDYLGWDGEPTMVLTNPRGKGSMWRKAWVNGVDLFTKGWPEPFRLVQNEGRGLLMHGTREWCDYQVTAKITPHVASKAGIAARVQGMRRYYALVIARGDKIQLIKALGSETVVRETKLKWSFGKTYLLSLKVCGNLIKAWVGRKLVFDITDFTKPIMNGAVALVIEEGRMATDAVVVQGAKRKIRQSTRRVGE